MFLGLGMRSYSLTSQEFADVVKFTARVLRFGAIARILLLCPPYPHVPVLLRVDISMFCTVS